MAVTKLDGTAKGGVVIGISDQFQIPVKYIGVGEGIDDSMFELELKELSWVKQPVSEFAPQSEKDNAGYGSRFGHSLTSLGDDDAMWLV